jgi:hypothetical protein
MLSDDGTSFSTQVLVVTCAWVPMVMSYLVRHLTSSFLEDTTPTLLARY